MTTTRVELLRRAAMSKQSEVAAAAAAAKEEEAGFGDESGAGRKDDVARVSQVITSVG